MKSYHTFTSCILVPFAFAHNVDVALGLFWDEAFYGPAGSSCICARNGKEVIGTVTASQGMKCLR